MLFYQIVLAGATLVSAASAGFIYAQAPDRRASQLFALAMLSGAYWSGCELGWTFAKEPAEAAIWMRVSAPGWLMVGAIVPHLVFHSLAQSSFLAFQRWRNLQGWVAGFAYVVAGVATVLFASGTISLGETSPTPWGWSFRPGAGFFVYYVGAMTAILVSCFVISRATSGASMAESLQLPWVWIAIGVPFALIFTMNVLLPLLEIDVPRVGSASLAVTGAIMAWTVLHYGLSMITSRGFGDEILETLEDGVALLSADGAIRRANRALAGLSGHSPEELAGMRMSELIDRDFREPSELEDMRRELLRRDGERIPVSVSIGVLRERQENEVGVVVVVRDLRELEELRRSSVTNARLAAVGELAAGLAHEINNPIAFVGSNLRMLRDHWEQVTASGRSAVVSEGRELIAESIEGVERAAEIVRGVKDFSHTPSIERRPVHLSELIDESVRMIRSQVGPRVRIESEYADLPPILGSPRELEQVFLNLLINAVHAVEDDGVVRISTRLEGDTAVVCFEDDGHGIAPDRIDRIFDPFFTTKPVGEGTGLGLGIAHHIVTQHGGSISVHSKPGEGATFRVNLPVS